MPKRIIDVFKIVEIQIEQGGSLAMASCERDRLRQTIGQQRTIWQPSKEVAFGLKGHLYCGVLGDLGHRLRMNRGDDQTLVGFQQLCLAVCATLGSSYDLFALVGNLVSQIGGLLTQISGLFTGKYSGLARGEHRRGRSGTITLICLKFPSSRAFWTSTVDVA